MRAINKYGEQVVEVNQGQPGDPLKPWYVTLASGPTTLSEAIIDENTSGDHAIVAGVTAKQVKVFKMLLVVNGKTEISVKDSAGGSDLVPPMSLSKGGSVVLDLSSSPWFTSLVNEAFVINSSAAVQISGRVYFVQE